MMKRVSNSNLKLLLIGLCVAVSFFSTIFTASAEEKNEKKEKTYTEAEFQAAVIKEVERRLIRLGKNEIINFSKELMEKERDLNIRDDVLSQREQSIKISADDLAKKVIDFEARQSKLISCLDGVDKQKKDRVRHMVDTISGMKPQSAADLLSVQEAELAVEILAALESAKVSKIFNMMDKEISARLQKQYMTMKK